jgi:hypothetical protein
LVHTNINYDKVINKNICYFDIHPVASTNEQCYKFIPWYIYYVDNVPSLSYHKTG